MNIALWIVQIVLALIFAAAGLLKLVTPTAKLNASMQWTNDFSGRTVKFIGAMELLGALGLVLPWATGIATILTPLAACGLAIVMLGALATHIRRHERREIVTNAILFVLLVFVAVGRFVG